MDDGQGGRRPFHKLRKKKSIAQTSRHSPRNENRIGLGRDKPGRRTKVDGESSSTEFVVAVEEFAQSGVFRVLHERE